MIAAFCAHSTQDEQERLHRDCDELGAHRNSERRGSPKHWAAGDFAIQNGGARSAMSVDPVDHHMGLLHTAEDQLQNWVAGPSLVPYCVLRQIGSQQYLPNPLSVPAPGAPSLRGPDS